MTPLVGAVLAAIAAEMEAAFGATIPCSGSLKSRCWPTWPRWHGCALRRSRRSVVTEFAAKSGPNTIASRKTCPAAWSCVTVVVIALAVAWPLQALRAPILAYDGYAIWTMHSLFIYGGHNILQSALTNPVYRFSNPNYPPLVPASGALAFVAEGGVDLRLAVIITAVLNACALGAVGCAIVATVGKSLASFPASRRWSRERASA